MSSTSTEIVTSAFNYFTKTYVKGDVVEMKKTGVFIVAAMFILCLSIIFSGCLFRKTDRFRLEESLVNGVGSFPTGEEDDVECVTVDYSYYVAKYQITFTLWEEIYDWATDETRGDKHQCPRCNGLVQCPNGIL